MAEKTSEQARVTEYVLRLPSPGFGSLPLTEFSQLARELSGRYFKSSLAADLTKLDLLREKVNATTSGHSQMSIIQVVMDRVRDIFGAADEDDYLLNHQDELQILVWHLDRANTPAFEFNVHDPLAMVQALATTLSQFRECASRWITWNKYSLLHEDDSRLVSDPISYNAVYAFSDLKLLLLNNVDRWIHPRLGLPPDQWTTRLNVIVSPLVRQLGPFSHPTLDQVRSLSDALLPFIDELGLLRFDASAEGSGQVPDGTDAPDDYETTVVYKSEPFLMKLDRTFDDGQKSYLGLTFDIDEDQCLLKREGYQNSIDFIGQPTRLAVVRGLYSACEEGAANEDLAGSPGNFYT
ncbi:MAG: hypothetical protein HYV60_20715, partial [Planctomycetia bacterium]|nr:hypothetical protein [Planctomycetia bacterium]